MNKTEIELNAQKGVCMKTSQARLGNAGIAHVFGAWNISAHTSLATVKLVGPTPAAFPVHHRHAAIEEVEYDVCCKCGNLYGSTTCTGCLDCSDRQSCQKKVLKKNSNTAWYCPECEKGIAYTCVSCGAMHSCGDKKCVSCEGSVKANCLTKFHFAVKGKCGMCERKDEIDEQLSIIERKVRVFNAVMAWKLLRAFKDCCIAVISQEKVLHNTCPGHAGTLVALVEYGYSATGAKEITEAIIDDIINAHYRWKKSLIF